MVLTGKTSKTGTDSSLLRNDANFKFLLLYKSLRKFKFKALYNFLFSVLTCSKKPSFGLYFE